jgi:hypothetical protein
MGRPGVALGAERPGLGWSVEVWARDPEERWRGPDWLRP